MTALVVVDAALDHRLNPCSLEMQRAELSAVIGPNGGGKTSLLKAIAAVDGTSGQVTVDGRQIRSASPILRGRMMTLVPASREVVWPIPVRDLVALAIEPPPRIAVDEALAVFELSEIVDRPVDRLSTGERSRVLLARAFAQNAAVMLLDEPFAHLDPYWVLRLTEELRARADRGTTIIVALHDLGLLTHFDRALLVANGSIEADLPPDDILNHPGFARHFRISAGPQGWKIRPADPQSSP